MLELIKNKLEENNIDFSWHTGSVPQQKRREMIKQFKHDPNCRLFLSTDSGSVGLNLQVANVVINMDLPWNPAKLEQRIARAWRKNQMRPVQVINLVTKNSIEHRMLYLLEQKQRLNVIKLDKKQIEQAQNYLTQAERKQKMASLLIQGDFAEEAITPLKQAVESSIHAFASLKNIYCDQEPIDLSTSNVHETFIQPVLVEQHNMPERVTTLFNQLYVAEDVDVQVLYDDHQHIINHIRTHFEEVVL